MDPKLGRHISLLVEPMLNTLFFEYQIGQLFRFRLIKFSTLVALLLTVCVCDDHDIVLSIATPKYVWDFFIIEIMT